MNIKRMLNKLIVLVCIIGLIFPSISLVADAAFEDKENTVIKLGVSILHPKKDTKGNRFGYKIGDRITYRTYINKDGSIDYSTYIFCLNMNGKFPQEDGTKNSNYTSKGELKKENSPISEDNTKKILYLLKNSDLYGKFEDKISTVYAKRIEEDKDLIPPTTVDTIKGIITDDDLFFAMQVAIWEITNNLKITENAVTYTIDEKVYNGQGTYQSKAELIACAIEYYRNLVSKYNTSDSVNTNPSIKKTDKTTVEEENYLYVGPFNITSGTNNNFNVTFKDQDGKALTGYSLVDAQNSTGKKVVNIKTALDKDLYVKLPVLTTTTKIKMELDVTGKKENSVALWTSNIANAQPLVSVNPKNIHEETEAPITKKVKTYDVALRKYITKVNGTEISDTRVPVVTEQPLDADYNKGDFKYSHRKDPVEVEAGQTVTYAIQIYNECENTVIVKGIKDYLPNGLELVKEDESNKSWTQIEGTNEIILSSDMQLDPVEIDSAGKKHAKSVIKEVTCRVKEDVEDGKILTNVAEVIGLTNKDGIDVADEDSNKLLSDASKDNPSYRGSTTESNLSRSDYYYFGEEDDDDFEKVVVKSKVEKQELDLALRKYITTLNGENKDRKPEVNADKLAKEEATTAEYNHPKTPVSVKTGDIVIYTIRVYNEGNEDAYVNEITDYIPEGLGFLVNHGINYNNGWKITTKDSKTVKLSDIANATKNISKTDFIDDGEVANEDVIVGKATIKTDILKYTEGGNKNKIPAFDKTSKEPSSVFVQVACVVVADKLDEKVLKNIAAITAEANKDGIQVSDKSDVKDRDSQPNEIDVNTYPENSNIQDDDDYEDLILTEKEYDLALKKFITTVKTPKADGTYDQVDYSTRLQKEDGTTLVDTKNGDYKLDKTLVKVKNGDTVVYTIRIYNEGEVEAIAKEVIDNLPEGLEFIEYVKDESGKFVSGSELNYKYGWEKFERESEKGWTSGLKTTYLSDKPIEAFDKENKNVIPHKDLQIEFKVVSKSSTPIKNIAEITDDDGDDRDSEPDNKKEEEDDQDYDNIIPAVFDLGLQKFITGINNKEIKDREPKVIVNEKGEISYTHTADPLTVANKNVVTYTIRVYNEGNINGYASVIKDDIPDGLVFLPEHETNKKYMWKMYRTVKEGDDKTKLTIVTLGGKEYVEVKESKDAEIILTEYYSKANSDARHEEAIKAFNPESGIADKNPDYRDVKATFEVDQTKIKQEDRIIINTAEIADDQDEEGNPVDDIDSTPNNDKEGEDDIDNEKLTVKYFDLSLLKFVSQVRVTEDGKTKVTNTGYNGTENPDPVVKVEIHRKKLKTTSVVFIYKIKVTNEGEIEGYAKEIKDYIPKGLEFVESDNKKFNWKQNKDGSISTDYLKDTLLKPGESATVEIALRWKKASNNLGLKTNVAEISEDYNEYNTPDIDSIPNNRKDGEDDQDEAPVILSISTGGTQVYILLIMGTISILSCGIYAIKKYVLI